MDIDKVIVKEVTGCRDCPFKKRLIGGTYACTFSQDVKDWKELPNKPQEAPEWCPLKKNPVLVQIK